MKFLLLLLFFSGHVYAGQESSVSNFWDGAVIHMNEGSGGTTVDQVHITTGIGTVTNLTWVTGKVSNGLSAGASGSTRSIAFTTNTDYFPSAAGMSVCGWFRFTSIGGASNGDAHFYDTSLDGGGNINDLVWYLDGRNTGTPGTYVWQVWIFQSGHYIYRANIAQTKTLNWTHLCWTYDGSLASAAGFKYYMNGVEMNEGAPGGTPPLAGFPASTYPLHIFGQGTEYGINVMIDEVLAKKGILTLHQVSETYSKGLGRHHAKN